jgi:hypothetical protein
MKIFIGLIVFVGTIFAGTASLAGTGSQAGGAHRDNTALFPPKVPDKAFSTVPNAPELMSPAFMKALSETSVKLEWKAVEGVEVYHVQVATDPNFKWLKSEQNLLKATSFDVADLEAGKSYYWRVAAVKPENMSTYTKSTFTKSMFKTAGAK